jgi:hypothetical protein
MRSNKEKKKPKQDKKAPAAGAAGFDKGVSASPSGGMGSKKKG